MSVNEAGAHLHRSYRGEGQELCSHKEKTASSGSDQGPSDGQQCLCEVAIVPLNAK